MFLDKKNSMGLQQSSGVNHMNKTNGPLLNESMDRCIDG